MSLYVHSVFQSISGEVNPFGQGTDTTFVRLGGCNLKCKWCDTPQTQPMFAAGYEKLTVDEVYTKIREINVMPVMITGGEPLVQYDEVEELCCRIVYDFISGVVIETNGTIEIFNAPNVHWSVDWKPPSSGHGESFLDDNYVNLPYGSQIKCVIDTITDLEAFLIWADNSSKEYTKDRQDILGLPKVEPSLVLSATSPDKLKFTYNLIKGFQKEGAYNVQDRRLYFSLQIHKILGLE